MTYLSESTMPETVVHEETMGRIDRLRANAGIVAGIAFMGLHIAAAADSLTDSGVIGGVMTEISEATADAANYIHDSLID